MNLPIEPDFIIVGSGVAGLTAALKSPRDKKVLVITKTANVPSGSSPLAQGGIAASVGDDDSPILHYNDTIKAGGYSALADQVAFLATQGVSAIDGLLDINMHFDLSDDGSLERNREGAHSRRRVLKAGGDATGKILVETLYKEAIERKNIFWLQNFFVYDLIIEDDVIQGIIGFSKNNGWTDIKSPRVLLATGGLGQLFGHTTNPLEATGDSMAMAIRRNLKLKEVEMVQFHPTALDIGNGVSLKLLTEALRGDGGVLVLEDGTQFMERYSPLKDLASRDIVSRAIWSEITKGQRVFLNLQSITNIEKKFPTVTGFCQKVGLNPKTDIVPVTPAVHYVMGGIDINSSLPIGLGVAGEAAYTGVHGANRLASNSLLECLVYGKSQTDKVFSTYSKSIETKISFPNLNIPTLGFLGNSLKSLQHIMYNFCGIIRDEQNLKKGLILLGELEENIKKEPKTIKNEFSIVVQWLELTNMIILGKSLIASALYRKESRGAHYRSDYPNKSPKWDRVKLREIKNGIKRNSV